MNEKEAPFSRCSKCLRASEAFVCAACGANGTVVLLRAWVRRLRAQLARWEQRLADAEMLAAT